MRLLILGVNGFIGQAVAAAAVNNGFDVVGVSRSAAPASPDGIRYLRADRGRPDAIHEIVTSQRVDAIVDVIAYTCPPTRSLLEALGDKVARYVLLSSSDVYRAYGQIIRQDHGAAPTEPLAETAPLRESRYPYRSATLRSDGDPLRWLDDYDKIPIESLVTDLAPEWAILRLPMVYGPGDKQRRFKWLLEHMNRSTAPLVIHDIWAAWVTTYGYIDDVAEAIVSAVDHPRAANAIFNLGEPSPSDQLAWAKTFAEAADWPGTITTSEEPDSCRAAAAQSMDLTVALHVDSRKLRRDLDYAEPTNPADRLERTLADERDRGF